VSRVTIRVRLTLVYSGLLMLAGALLLVVMYALMSSRLRPERELAPEIQPKDGAAAQGQIELMNFLHDDTMRTLLTQGTTALAAISVVAIVVVWLIAGRMLRPLKRVTETARRIGAATAADPRLHERIALEGPGDEVKELADTFDTMLQRLDDSFDGQRRFIANASHELRTPLTLNRALIEVAVHRRDASPEIRQLGETLLEINSRHERLIDGLLLLARSERDLVDRSYVDLADLARHVADQLAPGEVAVHTEVDEAPTTGNAVLLERLVRNLVDNAIRYNEPTGGWVRLRTWTGPGGEAELEVANTGPVVPRYEVRELFEPFRRLDSDRGTGERPGTGLGLSIVRSIAEAHGGTVSAVPRPGGGLTVAVSLPPPPD
jgi:signal transduction histidine kinase